MTARGEVRVADVNVWRIGESKRELRVKNHFVAGGCLTCLSRLVAQKLVIVPLSEIKESLSLSENAFQLAFTLPLQTRSATRWLEL